jgi:hypothetical protein
MSEPSVNVNPFSQSCYKILIREKRLGSMIDLLKNVLSLFAAVLPLLEKHFDLLPVNPLVREDVWLISVIITGIVGLGGYQASRCLRGFRSIGWVGIVLLIPVLLFEIAITTTTLHFGFSPQVISFLARGGYVLTFCLLGLALGGFIGLG